MNVHIYAWVYIHTYIYIKYMSVYIYIHIYVYIYIIYMAADFLYTNIIHMYIVKGGGQSQTRVLRKLVS